MSARKSGSRVVIPERDCTCARRKAVAVIFMLNFFQRPRFSCSILTASSPRPLRYLGKIAERNSMGGENRFWEVRMDFAVTLPSNNGFIFDCCRASQNRRRLPPQGLNSVSSPVPDALRPFDRGGGDADHNSGQRFEMARIIRAVLTASSIRRRSAETPLKTRQGIAASCRSSGSAPRKRSLRQA
jgi:hypothetical protein